MLITLQSALLAGLVLMGYYRAYPLAGLAIALLFGVLAWLGTAAVLIMKSRHRE
jgi:hypothetical protein